ncbi:TRAP transporter small permease [Roseivivax isoporae]|uniref:TRAP transporter small permease protein n=1 Tax=Roseivivax isoporae LMG 25204 TaxID=1449351 RepID=X7FBY8_9RHOB|nr:TRAP transporter small permease [Roseivivax isoporae]ETX30263.1 C4-dicarboxylate ABC transporter permease [Roseivivax isoporae LMG 25204]
MLTRIYDGVIHGLAALAALTFALMVVGIVVDVGLRNFGMRPVQATSALIEYGLLFATMAGAPWLIRDRGHVAIRALMGLLPAGLSRIIDRAALVLCVAILALLGWRAAVVAWEAVEAGAVDIRSIGLPGWILPAMICAGFVLMATEFLRLFLRGETYDASNAQH